MVMVRQKIRYLQQNSGLTEQYDNIPIGKSQRNIRSYIVDNDLNRLPVGASGELCHAGRQIARGYHNLPEKTASVFVENPFSICEEDKRLYRTGDMVRMKGDGNIEYIGQNRFTGKNQRIPY